MFTSANWLPLSMFLQFRKPINIYFLLITILTFMSFSPKKPFMMVMTFAVVLLFSMLKEGLEDRRK